MIDPNIGLAILYGAALLLGVLAWDRGCRCEKCGFHENARRMAAVEQVNLNHDHEHKGDGFKPGDPDVRDCHDQLCDRNRFARNEDGTL